MKPTAKTPSKPSLLDVPSDQLLTEFEKAKVPSFRLKQIYEWLFEKDAATFDAMSSLPAAMRQWLTQTWELHPLSIREKSASKLDGTIRYFFHSTHGQDVSTVYLPDDERLALCLSTQVGCAYKCTFCASGLVPFQRQLTPAEIVDQVLRIKKDQRPPTSLLFMGMGEPLANYSNVMAAIRLLTASNGLGMSASRITLSTSGLVPQIHKMADDGFTVKLAISLHAVRDDLRLKIMPVSGNFGVRELIKASKYYAYKSKAEVTFEYILLSGVNDRLVDAIRLSYLIKDFAHHVNIIPFNPVAGLRFNRPSEEDVLQFQGWLRKRGLKAFVRRAKGLDIGSACGQLGPG